MKTITTLAHMAFGAVAAAVLVAPGAHADVDTDFANQLHAYGIYGQRDYNAWIAKITCERLATHVDADAFKSATFLKTNMDRTSSTQQVWQFLGAAVALYCPEQTPVLRSAAESSSHTMKEQR
jgi:hypothetical protein